MTTKVPAAFSPTYVVTRVPSGTREMAVGGRKQWKITVLLTPVTHTHTLHTLLTSCPISLPYPILSHRTLQENSTALCVKVARAHSGTIVTKPASRPSPVIDDIPRIPRKVSSLAGGGRKLFQLCFLCFSLDRAHLTHSTNIHLTQAASSQLASGPETGEL